MGEGLPHTHHPHTPSTDRATPCPVKVRGSILHLDLGYRGAKHMSGRGGVGDGWGGNKNYANHMLPWYA